MNPIWGLSYPPDCPVFSFFCSATHLHWLLYALVLATTLTGSLFASFRGWSISFFYLIPLLLLVSDNAAAGRAIGLHQAMEWALLVFIGVHVAAALAHIFIYRDRVMRRMLPHPVLGERLKLGARGSTLCDCQFRAAIYDTFRVRILLAMR